MTRLYNIPKNSRIDVSHLGLEFEDGTGVKELNFKHIDGMYSLSFTDNGIPVHLKASTEVQLINQTTKK